MDSHIRQALTDGRGVFARSHYFHLRHHITWALRSGQIVSLRPGIYSTPALAERLDIRLRAIALADPDAIVTGEAAAYLHGWRSTQPTASICIASRRLRPSPGISITKRSIPVEQVLRHATGVLVTSKALTAVDLATTDGDPLDTALRHRVPLEELWRAFHACPHRRGNYVRRLLLRDSKDEPWSAAERLAHQVFRHRHITGWRSNYRVHLTGRVAYLDLAFPELKLAFEIDGHSFHASRVRFEDDRIRDQELAMAGWHVVRISAQQVFDNPDQVANMVKAVMASRRRSIHRSSNVKA